MQVHLIVLIIVLFLNIIPQRFINRKKYILPLSFLIIGVYLSIRYNYGPDYFNYMHIFYSGVEGKDYGTSEVLFYSFMHLFSKYYMFIIIHTIIVIITYFYFVRKYINTKYYALFFFLLLCSPGLFLNIISALRSTLAACVLFWGIELFYLRKKNLLLYSFSVIFAGLFHTSAIAFLILPFFEIIYRKFNSNILFLLLCLSLVLGMFLTEYIYSILYSFDMFNTYSMYSDKRTAMSASINATLLRSLFLFPAFYIIKYMKGRKDINLYFGMLSVLLLFIVFFNIDFETRFTTYLYLFFIVSISFVASSGIKLFERFVVILPIVIFTSLTFYKMYEAMYLNRFGDYYNGNLLFYQTIFSIPQLP